MARFEGLVGDVVLIIGEHFEHERDLNSLVRTSRPLHRILNPRLYAQHVRFHKSWALTWTAEYDRLDTAKTLLAAGADVMARTADEEPAIVVAAKSGSLDVAKLLCETEGVDPDWHDGDTPSAMTWAAKLGHEELVRYFLKDTRIDPQRQDSKGRTPLSYAAGNCRPRCVGLLLQDPRVDPALGARHLTPLSFAAERDEDNVEVIRLLLADPRANPSHATHAGYIALIVAAHSGSVANLRTLIDAGFDVNYHDGDNGTPLFYAAKGNEGATELLLATPGIDPNLGHADGTTPLIESADNENISTFRLLLSDDRVLLNAATEDVRTGDLCTALIYAAVAEEPDMVELMLGRPETDVNFGAEDGASALQRAIQSRRGDVARMLLWDKRLDPLIPNGTFWSPVLSAAKAGDSGLVRLLCEDGRFHLLDLDPWGRNAMSVAASRGWVNVVRYLLEFVEERDVDFHVRDINGATPYMLAVERGKQEMIELLEPFKDRG